MRPRIRGIRTISSPSVHIFQSIRSFKTSGRPYRNTPLFPHAQTQNKPKSKYNLQSVRSTPKTAANDPFKWSTLRPSSPSPIFSPIPNRAWEINAEQNILNSIRISPVGINPKAKPDEEKLVKYEEWNKQYGKPLAPCTIYLAMEKLIIAKGYRHAMLARKFSLPLAPGQLYTPRDLTFQAWEERHKVKEAATEYMAVDPFKRINVNPLEEYKVTSPEYKADEELELII